MTKITKAYLLPHWIGMCTSNYNLVENTTPVVAFGTSANGFKSVIKSISSYYLKSKIPDSTRPKAPLMIQQLKKYWPTGSHLINIFG